MQKKRLLLVGGSVLAITVVGLLVAPSFVDWSKYQTLATTKIAESTGYDVKINGAFRVAFLPRPHLSASDIAVVKPNGGRAVTLATLGNADVSLALLPLLRGRIDISSITLDSPNIQLVKYADGTDNWSPKPKETAEGQATPDQAAGEQSTGPDIAIGALNIKNGQIGYVDEGAKISYRAGIEKLKLKMDALSGPYEGEGTISYNNAAFNIDLSSGGYREGQTIPVRLVVDDTKSRASVTWNGVVATTPAFEGQGEIQLKFSDLGAVLGDANIPVNIPALPGTTALSGMLTASPARVSLTNGSLQIDKTRLATAFAWQKSENDTQIITARMETPDVIDIDALLKQLPSKPESSGKSAQSGANTTAAPAADAITPFLPAGLRLPENLSGELALRTGGLKYKGQNTGAFAIEATIPQTGNTAGIRTSLAELPGGGDVTGTATLTAAGTPSLNGTMIASLPSLKGTLSDWLGVIDAKTLAQPGMPGRANAEITYAVSGQTASATIETLSFGETKVSGNVRYRKAAPRPVVTAQIDANLFNLPAPPAAASPSVTEPAKKTDAAPAPKAFKINAPQLPVDVNFDLKLGRFSRGDNVLSDISAAGSYVGKSLTLSNAQATTKGGTLNASGKIADLDTLSGIDIQAGLRTSDLEGFYKAITANDLPLKQTIGAFQASVKAKGDSKKLDTVLNAQARGFTVDASGTIDDPFTPGIPGGMSVRVRHNDYIQAMRVFSPDFGSGSGVPIDIAGDITINDKVYDIKNMRATMGKSDMQGSLRADMSGPKPSFKADLASKNLELGSFVGVETKSPAAASSNIQTVSANNTGRWSRDPLDTAFLSSMALDIAVKADRLTYGTWELTDATLGGKMSGGALRLNPVNAKIYGGTFTADLGANAAPNTPMVVTLTAEGKDADIGAFLSALTSNARKKADGTGSFAIDIKTTGASPAALVSGVNGKADVSANGLVIHGMDLDKLAANLVEAFDGGWKGVLAAIPSDGLATGSTRFKDISHTFNITNGTLPVNNLRLETTSSNAIMTSNGNVNFSAWTMDLDNQVQVTQPKDVPVMGVRLSGPLNNPQKNINSAALDNLLREKVGGQVQKLLDKNIKDENVRGLVGGILGIQPQQPAPQQQPPTQQQAPAQQPAPAKTPEQQLLEGLGGLLGGR